MDDLFMKAKEFNPKMIEWRRKLHQNPELGFEEYVTSSFIREQLDILKVDEIKQIAGTGISALIKGKSQGPTVMLRADMDALPIQDEKDVPYRSKVKNKAHLCGHDAHVTMMLGVVKLLSEVEIETGNIQIIFQPAEEGLAGAKKMIDENVLDFYKVKAAAALHVQPTLPTGFVTVSPKVSTANSDRFVLKIIGKGGHAAHPHQTIDSIAVTAQVISSIQHIVSRKLNPLDSAVITIGKIQGGFARNIIAPCVTLEGTVRTLEKDIKLMVQNELERVVSGVCLAFGATYEFDYEEGYPSVRNDPELISLFEETTEKVLGKNKLTFNSPSMGGEDFSYYTEKVPSLFFRLGVRNEKKGVIYPHHHPLFDIDEEAMPYGTALLAQFALDFLKQHQVKTTNNYMYSEVK
ncbi:M20 metallopeptidase family protein [Halalkalibacter alkalisediminis]|uniref:M20 family metallopeptidase n=1 Tax=Halalkalibacter alkalisediminis TaxID=935616 RepID=A0ABV6NNE8_9BACI|nr:amidohydrolase [Halalkalibacter alkalisediminis]